jgi:hypothetical protein
MILSVSSSNVGMNRNVREIIIAIDSTGNFMSLNGFNTFSKP